MEKHVLITGASRGIGMEAARAFAEKGYRLTLCCRTHLDEMTEFARSLYREKRAVVQCIGADVGDPDQVRSLIDRMQKNLGPADLLINNAGISSVGLVTDLTDGEWNRVIQTNLSSVFYLSRAVLPHMIRQKDGVIVNVSSVFGSAGASCEAAYAASKGGVNAFTKSLAKELAPSNIRVNAVAFGCVDTRMNDNLSQSEKKALAWEIPAGHFTTAREAGAFLLQVAESPSYLNGQVISFDGAWM